MHVRGAAHPAAGWSECARNAVHAFIRTLAKQSTECTKPGIVVPATSSFPRLARAAVPAEPGRGDRSTVFDHKIATVVIQTIRDSWLRSFRVPGAAGRVTGLRGGGGRFDYGTFQDHATISLRGTRFARNVAVAGTTTLTYETNVVKASVRIVCPRGRTGRLTAHGRFGFGGPYLSFIVSGSLAGRHVHVVVPAN
jgi:hypothetical protein